MMLRLVAMIVVGTALSPRAHGQEIDESHVKAAFLYNFAKFVEWPSQTFKTPGDPILVCVLGRDPFRKALEEVMRGKSIDGRAFEFRQVGDAEEANACQILFVSAAEDKHYRTLLGSLKAAGILTIGEEQGF